jgi:class 3 adenylate cyclase
MLCSGCSQENRDGAKFCHACGTPLQAICASCHAALNPDHAFCDNCGHAVGAGAAARTPQQMSHPGLDPSIDRVYSNAEAAHPDLRIHSAPDGTIAIMFLDIEGSTAIADRVGDLRFMDLLREHNQIVREQVKAHDGFETKAEGDGFMIVFHSARYGLDCAIGIQKGLAERNKVHEEQVRSRIGLHAGETIREGDDFFGRNVILAARVASEASGGEVLVSGVFKALVESAGDLEWGEPRIAELRGLGSNHELWPIIWAD